MQQPRLVLFPQQALDNTIDFIALLTDIQLIDNHFDFKQQTHYLVGQQFFQHITFLGCSPFIKTEIPDDINDVNFCHIEIVPLQTELQFFHSAQLKPPRCPHCKYVIQNWRELLTQWQQNKSQHRYTCPECKLTMTMPELSWSSKAGFARTMINIWGIFEGEAIPNFTLLAQLQQWTNVNWQYCHATSEVY